MNRTNHYLHILTLQHLGTRARVSCTCGFRRTCRNQRRAGNTIAHHRLHNVINSQRNVALRSRPIDWYFQDMIRNRPRTAQVENDEVETMISRGGDVIEVPRLSFYRGPAEWTLPDGDGN